MKKDLPIITVQTVPNGYVLTVGKKDYLYFTPETLLAGVMLRVGCQMTGDLDTKSMINIMAAVCTWDTIADATVSNSKLLADNFQLQKTITSVRNDNALLRSKISTLELRVENLQRTADVSTAKLAHYDQMKQTLQKREAKIQEQKAVIKVRARAKDEEPCPEVREKLSRIARKEEKQKADPIPRCNPRMVNAHKRSPHPEVAVTQQGYDALKTPLTREATGLHNRTLAALIIAGGDINYSIGDVAGLSINELLEVRGCGNYSIKEFAQWLEDHHLALHMDVKSYLREYEQKKKKQ